MSFVNKWPIYFPSHQWTRGTWFIFSVLEAMEWKREGGQWKWGGWTPAAFTFCANNHRKSINVSLNEPYIGAILIRTKKKSNSKCKKLLSEWQMVALHHLGCILVQTFIFWSSEGTCPGCFLTGIYNQNYSNSYATNSIISDLKTSTLSSVGMLVSAPEKKTFLLSMSQNVGLLSQMFEPET